MNHQKNVEDYISLLRKGFTVPSLSNDIDVNDDLLERMIVDDNSTTESVRLCYYVVEYMFNRIFMVYNNKDLGDYLGFKDGGADLFDEYNEKFFNNHNGLWPSIVVDFIAKLDNEVHALESDRQFFDEYSPSYMTFDCSLKELINNMPDVAYHTLVEIVNKGNLFYWNDFIKEYLDRGD